jgi:hypothetical protein
VLGKLPRHGGLPGAKAANHENALHWVAAA